MTVKTFTNLRDAARAIERDARARDRRVRVDAVRKTARATRNYVYREIPRAFGELADSLFVQDAVNGAAVIADAPHAEAVEKGSRPHPPPLEPLIAWVKLRGMQGLTRAGKVIKNRTRYGVIRDPRKEAARTIATALSQRSRGGSTPVDAAEQVARAIQQKIATAGTRPQRFMAQSIPQALSYLDQFVNEALPDR